MLDGVQLPDEPRCLEVGCGQGAVTRVLVEEFSARVVASDYDPRQLAIARDGLADLPSDRVEFRQVDSRELPFEDSSFDLVAEFEVWHHIPGGWRDAAAEVSRVLRDGGVFVFTDEVLSPWAGRAAKRLLRLDALADDSLREELASNGFQMQSYESRLNPWGMKHCEGVAVKRGRVE